MSISPIGIFDSGIGGTTVWRAINRLLPNENTLYLADSKNAPYGQKSKEEIIVLSKKNTEFLISHKAKLIVVACNTATTNAIKKLREDYPQMPFVGIEPAIKPAALYSTTGVIGVLATEGTLVSELFLQTTLNFASELKVMTQVGYELVEIMEKEGITAPKLEELLKQYLLPMKANGMDKLVLGCTHYPYLKPIIEKVVGSGITVLDPSEAIAQQVNRLLKQRNIENVEEKKGNCQFFTNKSEEVLNQVLQKDGYNAQQMNF